MCAQPLPLLSLFLYVCAPDLCSPTPCAAQTFRVCNELVDDIVVVSDDEICAAVRDAFEDTRAVLEPAGALAIAGLKKYVEALPSCNGNSKGNFAAISSDASNIEFDILRCAGAISLNSSTPATPRLQCHACNATPATPRLQRHACNATPATPRRA